MTSRKKIARDLHPVAASLERALEQCCSRIVLCTVDDITGDMSIVSAPGMDRFAILGMLAHSQTIASIHDLDTGDNDA